MQILQQGENHWKLRIESEDDLWVLARLASHGRHLAMLGERRDTTTAESGAEERNIMAMTGHKTTQMVRRYIKEANLFKNNALNKIKI